MSSLRDIAKPIPRSRTTELKDVKILLKEEKPKTAKVYPSDKIFAKFPKDLVSPIVITGIVDTKTMRATLKGFISVNPHLNYLFRTKSEYTPGYQYWFLDKETNLRIIVSEEDVTDRKNLTKRLGNGYVIEKIDPENKEEIGNAYCRKV
jgi:hypothetical protein